MSTNDSSTTNAPSTYAAKLLAALQVSMSGAGDRATQAVQNLGLVQQARLAQAQRSSAKASSTAAKDTATLSTDQAKLQVQQSLVSRLSAIHQQASTPAPNVSANGWALHGRVYDAQLNVMSGLTVFFVDPSKAYLAQYGFSFTDATGYFLINFTEATPPATTSPTLFVEIANQSSQPIYLDASAFQPVTGAATYRNFILPAGASPLGTPPADVRKIAMPASKT